MKCNNLRKETMKEIDLWLEKQEQKEKKRLDRKRQKYFKLLAKTERVIKKYKYPDQEKLNRIKKKIRPYIKKHAYLPNSFRKELFEMVRKDGGTLEI